MVLCAAQNWRMNTTSTHIDDKLARAGLPFEMYPQLTLGYYGDTDLLVIRGGVDEDIYFTINRQNLVRFFKSYEALQTWLTQHRYQELGDEPDKAIARGPVRVEQPTLSVVK